MPTPIGRRPDACYQDEELDLSCHDEVAGHDSELAPAAEPDADPAPRGATAASDCDMRPDYLTFTGGGRFGLVALASGSTVDRYGNQYVSASFGIATPGAGFSETAGYLRDQARPCVPPSEATLESFLTGASRTEMLAFGAASGVTTSGNLQANEVGVGTPGASATLGYGWLVHDEKHPSERAR
jgi:hypothetical protein